MDFQVRISDTALADLEEIPEYSWTDLPADAERWFFLNRIESVNRGEVAEYNGIDRRVRFQRCLVYIHSAWNGLCNREA